MLLFGYIRVEEGVKSMKRFKGGESYKRLVTSALVNRVISGRGSIPELIVFA
jgi:hypothetical protein